MTVGLDDLLAAAALVVAWLALRRVQRDAKAARRDRARMREAMKAAAGALRKMATETPTVETKKATAEEIEQFVALSYGQAPKEPEKDDGLPKAFDRLTEDEAWALEWEEAGKPQAWMAPGGVGALFSEQQMEENEQLLKEARRKKAG